MLIIKKIVSCLVVLSMVFEYNPLSISQAVADPALPSADRINLPPATSAQEQQRAQNAAIGLINNRNELLNIMSDPPTPAFRVIDTDGNQTITADEAVAAYLGYRKGFGQQGTNLLYDVNGDGSVSEADLALLASAVTQETMPYWKAAILLDANQDGDVTVREVQAAVSAWQAEWGQSGAALRYDVNGDGKSDEPDLTIIQTAVPEILDSAGRVVYQALPDGLYAIYSYDPTGLAEKNILGVLTRVSGSQESDHYKNTSFLNKGDSPQNGEVVISTLRDGRRIVGIATEQAEVEWQWTDNLQQPLVIKYISYHNETDGTALPALLGLQIKRAPDWLTAIGIQEIESEYQRYITLADQYVPFGAIDYELNFVYANRVKVGSPFSLYITRCSPFPAEAIFLTAEPSFGLAWTGSGASASLQITLARFVLSQYTSTRELFVEFYDPDSRILLYRGKLMTEGTAFGISYRCQNLNQVQFPLGDIEWKIVDSQGQTIPSLLKAGIASGQVQYQPALIEQFAAFAKQHPDSAEAKAFENYLIAQVRRAVIRSETGTILFEETANQLTLRRQKVLSLWQTHQVAFIDKNGATALDLVLYDRFNELFSVYPKKVSQYLNVIYTSDYTGLPSYALAIAGKGRIELNYKMSEQTAQNFMNGLIRANWLSVLSHEIAHVYHRETQEVPDFVTFFKKLHDLSGDENNFVSPYARTHATEDFAEVASQIVEDFDVLLTKGLERFQNREPLFLEKMLYVMSHMFVEERNGKMVLLKSRREFMPLPTTTDYTDMRYVLDGILPAEKDNSGRITRLDYNGFSYRFTYDGDGRLVDIQKQSRSAMDNLDTNQDGVLTAAEAYPVLRAIVSAVGKQRGDVSWAEASKYDLDNNGVITSSEAMRHLNAFNAAATVQEQRRFVALENLDANKDGAVTAAEAYPVLRAVQNALAKKVGDAGWAEVAKYDLDKNLVITPTELATFINAFNAIASPGDQKLLKDLQTLEANKSTAAANFASWFDQGQLMIGSALSAQGSRYTGEPKALVDVINGILGAEYTIASPASGADQPVLQLVKYPSMILLAGTTNLYLDLQNNVVYEGSVKSAGFAKDNSSQSIQFKALVQKMFDTANGHIKSSVLVSADRQNLQRVMDLLKGKVSFTDIRDYKGRLTQRREYDPVTLRMTLWTVFNPDTGRPVQQLAYDPVTGRLTRLNLYDWVSGRLLLTQVYTYFASGKLQSVTVQYYYSTNGYVKY